MDLEAVKQWRRMRLAELAAKVGGNAALGRKLGYRDGAYVGQMVKGDRPITEETVEKAEKIRDERLGPTGARGWFDHRSESAGHEGPVVVDDAYAQLLRDLDDIPPAKRARLIDHIHQVAEESREAAAHHASRGTVSAARKTSGRNTATVSMGDSDPRQGSLPWSSVADPFNAEPDERERAWYEMIAKRPPR